MLCSSLPLIANRSETVSHWRPSPLSTLCGFYLQELLPHSWTHLLIHHKDNDPSLVHPSPPGSARHLDVLS